MNSIISFSTLQPLNLTQALDAFVLRSPHEAQPHVAAIFEHVQSCLAYDPNYADNMDAEDMAEEAEDDDECDSSSLARSFVDLMVQSQALSKCDSSFRHICQCEALVVDSGLGNVHHRLSDEGYSDDEDTSWKVRRAAAKCLSAVITEYPNLLQDIYAKASQSLIARLREREENVKLDVFNSFVDLIRQVHLFQAAVQIPCSILAGRLELLDDPNTTQRLTTALQW